MATRAVGFAEEQALSASLGFSRLFRIQLAIDAKLRGWWEVQQLLELRHKMHLTASVEDVDSFLRGDHRIPIEIGSALLKLREVLDALKGPL